MGVRILIILFVTLCCQFGAQAQLVEPDIRVGIIADPQYADKDSHGARFYRNSLVKLDTAVRFFNDSKLDFAIIVGDLVDLGIKDLPPVMQRLTKLESPLYNMLGNHDYVDSPNVDSLYRDFGMSAPYYVVEKGKWTFILLNTNELSAYATNPGTLNHQSWERMRDKLNAESRKNAQPWNGGISEEQMQWMEHQIKIAAKKTNDIIIFTHHPLLPENGLEVLNNREILAVLEKYPHVRAVISGHHHEGNLDEYKGIPIVTLEGMVETAYQNAYGMIELFQDKIVIKGSGRLSSRVFHFKR